MAGWEEGIMDNPYKGIYDMRNVDIVTIPGEASVAMKTQAVNTQGAITALTFTVDAGTSVFTYDGVVPLEVNTAIFFTGADLPAGLSQNQAYYIITTPTPTTFTISTYATGVQKTVSDIGSGVMTFTTIQLGTPVCYATGLYSFAYHYFMSDSNGRTWVLSTTYFGNITPLKWIYLNNLGSEDVSSADPILGIVYYKEFLLTFTTSGINALWLFNNYYATSNPYLKWATSGRWYNNWLICGSSSNDTRESRQALLAPNDIIYFCNQNYVGSLEEVDGAVFGLASTHTNNTGAMVSGSSTITTTTSFFSSKDIGSVIVGPNIPAGSKIIYFNNNKSVVIDNDATGSSSGETFTITQSYTYTADALFVSSNDLVNCIENFNAGILIGGVKNRIYYWDLLSNGWQNVIYLSENWVKRIVTVNNTAYIFGGHKGRIFITNGGNATPFWKIPEYLSNTTNPYIEWQDAIFNNNQLYFGFTMRTNANTTINECGGLWAVDVDASSPTYPRLQNILSYGTYNGYVSALCKYLMTGPLTSPSSDGYGLLIGWYNGSIGGVDKTISTPYTGGESYIILDPIPVGQLKTKRTFENLEYKLAAPLVSGETVALYYRTDLSSAFTLVPITSGGNTGDISGLTDTVNFENCQWVQIKVVLTGTATNPSYVRLTEVRLR